MVMYSTANNNGKQVRKNKQKKLIKNKTKKTKQKSQSAKSEKQKRRLHESELLSRQRVIPETTPCALRYA